MALDESVYQDGLCHDLPCKHEECWCKKVDTASKDYCPMSLWNKVEKPWGAYYDIYRSKTTVVKKIVINPGCRISYQKHEHRVEFWSIECGKGIMTLNNGTRSVWAGCQIYVDKHDLHRISNTGTEPLVFFEIQSGECSEDDIIRISDDYGR